MAPTFDELVADVAGRRLEGWDFSFLQGRLEAEREPWSYPERVNTLAASSSSLLDLGTGGGEFLSAVQPRPELTVATEGWMPNVGVADARLRPLGIGVVAVEGAPDNAVQRFTEVEGRLPFRDGVFEAVINRHEAFRATEVARILAPGGTFLTQQVGSRNEVELNEALGGEVAPCLSPTLEEYVGQLEAAGLRVTEAREAFPAKRYLDVGAVLALLLMVPWQYEGFDLDRHRDRLLQIHRHIEAHGAFEVRQHRFLLEGRPGGRAD
jgi:SAM-dependent methyltransferase